MLSCARPVRSLPLLFPLRRGRQLLACGALIAGLAMQGGPVASANSRAMLPGDWETVLEVARGQTIYWNAWGGDEKINAYMAWAGEQVQERYGITVNLVKVSDTAEVVSRLLAEKSAGRKDEGKVDLVWINGENFAALKDAGLLVKSFTPLLPSYKFVDLEGKPTTLIDFTVPTDGLEAPWGMAQFVFMHDGERLPEPPQSAQALLDWASSHPGRFTYPQPPDFLGSTFLKQSLVELLEDASPLQKPVDPDSEAGKALFDEVSAPLWAWLDQLHKVAWREGKGFPASGPALRQLFADGEVDMALSFHPAEASGLIDEGLLPPSTRTHIHQPGTIGNTHFLAIPSNAANNSKIASLVLIDFLLSPEAQLQKQNPEIWGDFTVLDMDALPAEQKDAFTALPTGDATLSFEELGKPLLEPHPSWMEALEAEWQRRYGN